MGQMPSREVVTIPEDQVTPEMRANAMFSPYNNRPGAPRPEVADESTEQPLSSTSEAVGSTVTESLVEVDDASTEPDKADDSFADIWSTEEPTGSVESAAVRPPVKPLTEGDKVAMRTQQQMDIDRADRTNRENAGLPPRTFDLR